MEFNQEQLQRALPCFEFYFFNEIESTNKTAKQWLEDGKVEKDAVLIADQQTGGYGSHARKWSGDQSGLYCSVIFPISNTVPINPGAITMQTATVIAQTLNEVYFTDVKLKWVNDLILNQKKLGGILCELVTNLNNEIIGLVIGFGINISKQSVPIELKSIAINLSENVSTDNNQKFLTQVLDGIQKSYHSEQNASWLNDYKELSTMYQQMVEVDLDDQHLVGRVVDFRDDGALVLKTADSVVPILAGTVSFHDQY
ncbi:biotin--[acetyl-CoA-carboxylase] ligase [Pediococcus argentinicus]|uniref:biotin--[acetyl-CoA-carboxylase] ligase n=1 Tax=Pediococcus argentinicus TaxID=480391 RepID=UPI00338F619D